MHSPGESSPSGRRERLARLEAFALEKGAYRAHVFPALDVCLDERVRLKCQIPLCPHFGRTLTCPPNVPAVAEFRRALANYRDAILVQTRSLLNGDIDSYDRDEVHRFLSRSAGTMQQQGGAGGGAQEDFWDVKGAAVRLHKLVNEVEENAMSLGFPYALGLIGGACELCPSCVGPGGGKGCRRPFEARPAMEGVGIDVLRTSVGAGLPFDMPPKTEIVWSGLVLID